MFDHNNNIPKDRPLVTDEGKTEYTDSPLINDSDRQDSLWNKLVTEAYQKSGNIKKDD